MESKAIRIFFHYMEVCKFQKKQLKELNILAPGDEDEVKWRGVGRNISFMLHDLLNDVHTLL